MGCFHALCGVLLLALAVKGEAIQRSWRPILPNVGGNYDSRHPNIPIGGIESPSSQEAFEQPRYDFDPQVGGQYQNEEGDQCTLYKVNFNQELYFQYIQYKIGIPEMKEFTLCMWTKFHNHSNDHPLFSYAVPDQPRSIFSWISNTDRASYFSMSVEGHTFFRLNYPLRLNRWYHSCQSWNSRTGEWQLWVNAERVGRGFHNRLVGHVVPGGGIAITGQEQRQFGGGFLEGQHGPPHSGGFLGEVTMLHLYAAALAPGKAHKDHKHHHGQHHHAPSTPRPAPAPTTPAPPPGFLVGNQQPGLLVLNLGNLQGQNIQPAPTPPNPTLHPLATLNGIQQLNGHLAPNLLFGQNQNLNQNLQNPNLNPNLNPLLGQQFTPTQYDNTGFAALPQGAQGQGQSGEIVQSTFHGNLQGFGTSQSGGFGNSQSGGFGNSQSGGFGNSQSGGFGNSQSGGFGNSQSGGFAQPDFAPGDFNNGGDFNYLGKRNSQRIFKRDDKKNVTKRSLEDTDLAKEMLKGSAADAGDDTKKAKRGIFGPDFTSSSEFGTQGLNFLQQPTTLLDVENQNLVLTGAPLRGGQKGGDEAYPREEAEGEVIKIMNVCSGCGIEPYKKAEVISWRNTPKKMYSGALYLPARPQCRKF